jgi:two-component system sensor histidine kinase/response regulator
MTIREGTHVLVVEDHPINQQLVLELLRGMRVEADLAQNGLQAIEMLAAHAPDHYAIVFMDLQMPVLDGYEATKRLRASGRYPNLPIIAMTAHVMMEEQERCFALGMRGHIGKPIDPDELHRVVSSFCMHEPAKTRPVAASEPLMKPVPLPSKTVSAPPDEGLPRAPGLDTSAGLARTRGNRKLYTSLLTQFVEGFRGFGEELTLLLREGKHEDATRLAHSLKGVAANVGAVDIAKAAGELEQKLDRGEHIEKSLGAVEASLNPVMTALAEQLGISDPTDPELDAQPVDLSAVALPEWVHELRKLLADGDVAAQMLWTERGDELKGLVPAGLHAQLRRTIESFEFDAALAALTPADA